MAGTNESPIREVISDFIDTFRIRGKYNEQLLNRNWEQIVGKTIADHTRRLAVRNDKLILTVDSAALKHELSLLQNRVIALANEHLGTEAINELVVR